MKKILLASVAFATLAMSAFAQNTEKKQPTAYLVSNAHLDSQWNWDIQTTLNEYIPKTLFRNLTLLEEYPDYIFNCESAVKYAWMKEYYPEAYDKLKKYIQEGRWHVAGTWEATDANIPSTESLTRNILYGQHFYEEEFGVRSTEIMLPDCFGFGQHLPTIAAHSGLIGFGTQKLQWRTNPFYGDSKVPFQFGRWQGLDGSQIMIAAEASNYNRKFNGEDLSYSDMIIEHAAKSPMNISYFYYGVGDIGGSPTIPSVQAVVKGVHGDGPLKVISATSDQLYKDLADADLEVWNDELTMDVHGTGCYTSEAAMKLFNRRNELMADAAERSAVAAEILTGMQYPMATINESWKRFIWHQFHDDLTGTSIPRAYEFSWNDEIISLNQFTSVMQSSVGAVSSLLDTKVSGTPVVIYNPSAFDRTDIVSLDGAWTLSDERGRSVKSQRSGDKTIFTATVPAMGYVVYNAKKSNAAVPASLSVKTISNSVYTLTVNEAGDITSIVDKRNGRQIVKEGKALRLAMFTDNKSYSWPAWEILKTTIDMEPVGINENVKISLAENGPVRKALKVEKTFGDSHFTQYICLNEGAYADRIDIINDVDWQSMHSLLKAEFPLNISNPKARYDIGTGSLERGNNTKIQYEVYAQQWADLAEPDGSYGVSILNDCKYGWDKPDDNTLRLSLLHTPETNRGYRYQDHQDLGHHMFTYSIVAHAGDWNSCNTVDKAEALNQPMKVFIAPKHKGELGRSYSFAKAEGVSLRAFKKAENGDGYVVRVYETTGKAHDASICFASNVISVEELNGNEDVIGKASANGNTINFNIGAFALKTYRVRLQSAGNNGIAQAPVKLDYGMRAATYNSFRADGNFDGQGYSYAAELLPESIMHNGINYQLEYPMNENAMRCLGNEIALPEGNWNKVYMLVAATKTDQKVSFNVGGKEQDVYVPYYSGFVGQWGHTGHTEGYMKNADIAFVGTHRHAMATNNDAAYEFTYMFSVCLDVPAGATSIKLPENKQVVIFSAVAANDQANTLTAGSDLMRIGVPVAEEPAKNTEATIVLLPEHVMGFSAQVNRGEAATMLLDDDISTKWCDNTNKPEKFVAFDLKKEKEIHGWHVLHATHEGKDYTTKDFALQVKDSADAEWRTVDSVTGNTDPVTDRKLPETVKAQYVRLLVTQGDQTSTNCARIYEFALN